MNRSVGKKHALYASVGVLLLATGHLVNLHMLGLRTLVAGTPEHPVFFVPFIGELQTTLRVHPAYLIIVGAAMAAGLAILLTKIRSDTRRAPWYIPKRQSKPQYLQAVFGIGLLLVGFVPIGPGKTLNNLHYLVTIPGFGFLVAALWPALSHLTDRLVPLYHRVVYGLSPGRFVLLVTSGTFVLSSLFALVLFQGTPHVPTGIGHTFHARIMLESGNLYVPSPSLEEFFRLSTIISHDGRWYSQFPPFHTLLVGIGLLFRLPWLVNPLIGALGVALFYYLGREAFEERVGRLAALLGLLSPFVIFMSSEYYNHATSLLLSTAILLFFIRLVKHARFIDAALAGLALGLLINTRPLTSVAVTLPLAFVALWLAVSRAREFAAKFALLGAIATIFAALHLVFNQLTTGDPFVFAYAYSPEGKGVDLLQLQYMIPHTVARIRLLNKYLFEWPIPGLVFVAALFVSGETKKWDLLLIAVFACGVLAYAGWYWPGFEFGPRYLYFATGALLVLTARGIYALPQLLASGTVSTPISNSKSGLKTFVLACFLVAAPLGWYPRARAYASEGWRFHLDTRIPALVREASLQNAVVYVPEADFRSVFLQNAIRVDDSEVIYVIDLGDRNVLMMEQYPQRSHYRVSGARLTPMQATR